MRNVLVKCIRFVLHLILLSQTRQTTGRISSDQYEDGTNEDPIRTGEHDAVAVAITRSSCALRAYPRPCLPHLRVHPVFIRLSELGSPDPPTSTARARFVRPPTAHDAAALAANPSIAPTRRSLLAEALNAILSSETRRVMCRSALHE